MVKRVFFFLLAIVIVSAHAHAQSDALTLQSTGKTSSSMRAWYSNADKSCQVIEKNDGTVIALARAPEHYRNQNGTVREVITIPPKPIHGQWFTQKDYLWVPRSQLIPVANVSREAIPISNGDIPIRGYQIFGAHCTEAANRDLPETIKQKFHGLFGVE